MTGMAAATALPLWIALVVLTMVPSVLPFARHVAVNSLRRRRTRAVGEFVGGYLAMWVAFGAVAVAVLPTETSRPFVAAVLVLAAGWQVSPVHRTVVRGCHRTWPLPATGARAEFAAVRFGVAHGGSCVALCWCLMLAMCCAPGPPVLWAAAVGAAAFAQKTTERPVHAARIGALVLLVLALLVSAT
jgi:predicted metal-binding membrane protein